MSASRVSLMGLLLAASTTAAAQEQVSFESDAVPIGTILSVGYIDRFDVTLEASSDGVPLQQRFTMAESSTLVGELQILDTGRKGPKSARLRYSEGGTTSRFAGESERSEDEVVGHSYTIALGGSELDIVREDGASISDAEREQIESDLDAIVDPLGEALPRKMTVGDTIDLGEWLEDIIDGAEELTVTLSELRGETAVFDTQLQFNGTDPDGITMGATFTGELLIDTQTRRMVSLVLEGPMSVSADIDGIQLTGEGTGELGMRYDSLSDPETAFPEDLDLLGLMAAAHSSLSTLERDTLEQTQQSRMDLTRQQMMSSPTGNTKAMLMSAMAEIHLMQGALTLGEPAATSWLRKAEMLFTSISSSYPTFQPAQLKRDMAMIHLMRGEAAQARQQAEESLAAAETPEQSAEAALVLAEALVMAGDPDGAIPYFEQAVAEPFALSAVAAYRLAAVTGKPLRLKKVVDSAGTAPAYTFDVDRLLRESRMQSPVD